MMSFTESERLSIGSDSSHRRPKKLVNSPAFSVLKASRKFANNLMENFSPRLPVWTMQLRPPKTSFIYTSNLLCRHMYWEITLNAPKPRKCPGWPQIELRFTHICLWYHALTDRYALLNQRRTIENANTIRGTNAERKLKFRPQYEWLHLHMSSIVEY